MMDLVVDVCQSFIPYVMVLIFGKDLDSALLYYRIWLFSNILYDLPQVSVLYYSIVLLLSSALDSYIRKELCDNERLNELYIMSMGVKLGMIIGATMLLQLL